MKVKGEAFAFDGNSLYCFYFIFCLLLSPRTLRAGGGRAPLLTGPLTAHSCLKYASTAVIASCGPWNDYSLRFVRDIAALCEAGHPALTIAAAAEKFCPQEMAT